MPVVGLDLGTQTCKAVICDDGLAVLGSGVATYPTHHPQPDHAEQDPRAWEAALGPAIASALARARLQASDITALAIVGQLDGCVAVDAACAPLHPALIWLDRRAVTETALARAPQVFALAGQVADPSHFAPKLAWLRSRVTAARYHQPTSYLVERLTGRAAIDPSLASTCMLLELSSGTWAPALLDAFAIDEAVLPPVRPTCEVAGTLTAEGARLTGLPIGTPVAVGTGDDFANPLGAGVVAPGPIVCALGTAEVVGALAATPVLDRAPEPMVETHAFPTTGEQSYFFVENPGWLSGGAVTWAVELLGLPDAAALDALAAQALPGAGGVTFIPSLAGAMTPVWRPHARGTLHGLAAGHGRAHIARAILEGLAFACRDVVDRLGVMGLSREHVVLLGGGANSKVWAQLRADAIGLRHEVVSTPDTAPIAAAMIAAVAAGIHPDLATAAALVARGVREVFRPSDRLDDAYDRYRTLVAQLAPLATAPWR